MALSEQDQRRIIEQESTWLDDGFASLDLSAFPNLQAPPPPPVHDDRFARDWRDTALSSSASALRQFVENPDTESLERVGNEIGSADYLHEVRDRRGELVAVEFKRRNPDYLPTDDNFRAMVQTLAFNGLPVALQNGTPEEVTQELIAAGLWTVPNLEAVYRALDGQGLLDVPAGEPRNLSERERLRVARLAQAGRVDEAIGEYLRCALDGEEPNLEMIHDPAYRAVCDDAVFYCFEEVTLDYVATPERQKYLLRHCGNRPLTIPLLQQAWAACKAHEARHERGELLTVFQPEAEPVNVKQIDALDDASVDRLYHDSLRAYADQFRRAPGVLA
jgi:hypothetical protein